MEARELPLVLEHPAAAPETRLVGLVEHNRIGILRAAEAPLALGTLTRRFESHDVAIEGGGTLEVGDHELDVAEFAVADHGGQFPRENEAQLAMRAQRLEIRCVASRRSIACRQSAWTAVSAV